MEEELTLHLGGPTPPEPASRPTRRHRGRPVDPLAEELLHMFEAAACTRPDFAGAPLLKKAARFALRAHVVPAIENEVHKALREVADEAAIHVFAENVRKLLLVGALRAQGGAGRGSRPAHGLQAGRGRRFRQVRGEHGHAPRIGRRKSRHRNPAAPSW